MNKLLSFVIVVLLISSGCNASNGQTPTVAVPAASPTAELVAMQPQLLTEIRLETQTGTSYTLSWSTDGESLAVASGGEVTILRADLNETQGILMTEGGALGVSWSPDKTRFVTVNGYRNPMFTLWDWDVSASMLVQSRQIQAGADLYGVAWSPDGDFLATLAGDSQSVIQIWDATQWEQLDSYHLPYVNPRRALQWSADSSTLFGAGQSGENIVIFALNDANGTVEELGVFPADQAEVFAISSGLRYIAVSDAGGNVQIFEAESGNILYEFQSVDQPVDMAWNPKNMTLAILGYNTALQLWAVP